MLRRSYIHFKPKTLHDMFRRLKLAGAHPDVLWAIDAQKAQHNGNEMIRLETLFHQRSTNNVSSPAPQTFQFWLKPQRLSGSSESLTSTVLRQVGCTITPRASAMIVKTQLKDLFEGAGITEDFEVGGEGVGAYGGLEVNLETVLRDADRKQADHIHQAGSLYIRGDKAISNLRQFGVLLVIEEDHMQYLVTLPENESSPKARAMQQYQQQQDLGGNGIVGANGQIDSETQDFLRDRGLKPFDLRMAGSFSSVERFVQCFERIEKLYEQHRGFAVRSCVCLIISLKGNANFVTEDGCIVLPVQQQATWEGFLLGLPQDVWRHCVDMHKQWRVDMAPKLHERRRRLIRVADMFHFFGVVMESRIGGQLAWQEALLDRFHKEEPTIRNAIQKYRLQSEVLKRRGYIHLVESLPSNLDPTKDIAFRIAGDGKLFFHHAKVTTPQMLKIIKDNFQALIKQTSVYDQQVTVLEHLSRQLPLDFSVDSDWKRIEEANVVRCLEVFASTMKANQAQLALFLKELVANGANVTASGGQGGPQQQRRQAMVQSAKRFVWIISNRFETMPSGVVFVPWNVDFESIKKMMISK